MWPTYINQQLIFPHFPLHNVVSITSDLVNAMIIKKIHTISNFFRRWRGVQCRLPQSGNLSTRFESPIPLRVLPETRRALTEIVIMKWYSSRDRTNNARFGALSDAVYSSPWRSLKRTGRARSPRLFDLPPYRAVFSPNRTLDLIKNSTNRNNFTISREAKIYFQLLTKRRWQI